MRLAPLAQLDDRGRERGMRLMMHEVVFSTFADALAGGAILTGFALHLGASSAGIGVLAAVIFWNQLLQGPGALMVGRLRNRKLIAVAGSLGMATAPLLMIMLAFAPPTLMSRYMLVALVILYGGSGAIAGCAWIAWVRDIVPDNRRGRFFGRRSMLAMATSIAGGLLAASLIDLHPQGSIERSWTFAGLFSAAFVAELFSALWLARTPEPRMPLTETIHTRLLPMYRETFGDSKFREWLAFVGSWQFAINLAQPFFTLYFLQRLGFTMSFVIILSMISQLAGLLTVSRWGTYLDRYKSKSILNVAAPTLLLCILGMVGASQFGSATITGAYLVVLHLILGLASAGVNLASSNMLMKVSPEGQAQAYIATNALVTAIAAGLAPLIGGFCQDFFAARGFSLALEWSGPRFKGEVMHLSVQSWDFYFLLSALIGLYALHRMALVREEGALVRSEMLREMREQSLLRRALADGVAALGNLPASVIRRRGRHRGDPGGDA